MKIVLAADHGGFALKEFIAGYLLSLGHAVHDLGCHSAESVDYPDFAHPLADAISHGQADLGFAFCGSANGITMTLNRHRAVRAAICWQPELATLARAHNNANICSMPGRFIDQQTAAQIADAFLNTPFEGGRHTKRVEKIEL